MMTYESFNFINERIMWAYRRTHRFNFKEVSKQIPRSSMTFDCLVRLSESQRMVQLYVYNQQLYEENE